MKLVFSGNSKTLVRLLFSSYPLSSRIFYICADLTRISIVDMLDLPIDYNTSSSFEWIRPCYKHNKIETIRSINLKTSRIYSKSSCFLQDLSFVCNFI